ncbi:MAG: hypothetical protein K5989_04680 [Lachnospiraceae bacterium]|nr:hypothetical protein [Lachnospiraceae bacterium]
MDNRKENLSVASQPIKADTSSKVLVNIFLTILMAAYFVLNFFISNTYAAGNYSASAALNYAQIHWNDGKGLCAEFVSRCLNAGGVSAFSARATVLRSQLNSSGLGQEYTCSFSNDGYLYQNNVPSSVAPGDVVFYYCPRCDDNRPYSIHVVLFNGFDSSGRMKAYSHNGANSGRYAYRYVTKKGTLRCYDCGRQITTAHVYHFNGNNSNSSINHRPTGVIDSVTGGNGTVTVGGWAFDTDDKAKSIQVHVYVGGPAGSGAPGYPIIADAYRPDVNRVYNVGNNHGFSRTINVDRRGSQKIYLYAIDGQNGPNTYLGYKTVNISSHLEFNYLDSPLKMKAGEKKDLRFTFKGDGIYTMNYSVTDSSIANMTSWGTIDWSKGTGAVTISAYKGGSTKLTINLLNKNKQTLYSKTVDIVVSEDYKINFERHINKTRIGEEYKVVFSFSGSNVAMIDHDISNLKIAEPIRWETIDPSAGKYAFVVKGKSEGATFLTIKLCDSNRKTLFSDSVSIITYETLAINLSKDNVELAVNDTVEVPFVHSGYGTYNIDVTDNNSNLIDISLQNGGANKDSKVKITGKNPGNATVTIKLSNSSGKTIVEKNINVTVKEAHKTTPVDIKFSQTSYTMEENTRQKIVFTFTGDEICTLSLDSDNESALNYGWDNVDWSKRTAEVFVIPHSAGKSKLFVKLLDKSGNLLLQKSTEIIVPEKETPDTSEEPDKDENEDDEQPSEAHEDKPDTPDDNQDDEKQNEDEQPSEAYEDKPDTPDDNQDDEKQNEDEQPSEAYEDKPDTPDDNQDDEKQNEDEQSQEDQNQDNQQEEPEEDSPVDIDDEAEETDTYINLDQDEYNVKIGESGTIRIKFDGNNISSLKGTLSRTGVISVKSFRTYRSRGEASISFTGVQPGKIRITVKLLDGSKNIICTKDATINVIK